MKAEITSTADLPATLDSTAELQAAGAVPLAFRTAQAVGAKNACGTSCTGVTTSLAATDISATAPRRALANGKRALAVMTLVCKIKFSAADMTKVTAAKTKVALPAFKDDYKAAVTTAIANDASLVGTINITGVTGVTSTAVAQDTPTVIGSANAVSLFTAFAVAVVGAGCQWMNM